MLEAGRSRFMSTGHFEMNSRFRTGQDMAYLNCNNVKAMHIFPDTRPKFKHIFNHGTVQEETSTYLVKVQFYSIHARITERKQEPPKTRIEKKKTMQQIKRQTPRQL